MEQTAPSQPRGLRVAANFVILSGGEMAGKVCLAIAFAFLARVLGPTGYGELELILAMIFFGTLAVDCGLGTYGARELAKDPGLFDRIAGQIVFLRCLLATASTLALVLVALVWDRPWGMKQALLLYSLGLWSGPWLLSWAFQGRDLMQYVAGASLLRAVVFTGGVLLLVRSPDQLWLVALVDLCANVGVVAFYLVSVRARFGTARHGLHRLGSFAALRQAAPIGAVELIWAAKMYLATIILGVLAGGEQVGWFTASHRLVVSLHTFVWLYYFNLLPSMSRSRSGPFAGTQRLLGRSIRLTAWAAVLVGLVGAALAEPLMAIVYGAAFAESVVSFRILIWVVPLLLLGGNFQYLLIADGKQRWNLASIGLAAMLNVVLCFVLIPTYGYVGAAVSLAAAEAVAGIVAYLAVRRFVGSIPLFAHLWAPVAAGAVLVGVAQLTAGGGVWLSTSLGVGAFGLIAVALQPELLARGAVWRYCQPLVRRLTW